MVIRQPMLAGDPASEDDVAEFFGSAGWKPFEAGGELAYFDPISHHAVSDTHMGNLVRMPDGQLAPIDLRGYKN